MTYDEVKTLKVGDWVMKHGDARGDTRGCVTEIQEDTVCITWQPSNTSWRHQWFRMGDFEKVELAPLPVWYQPVHYMNSAGAGWKIVPVSVLKEFPTYLMLESGRYVRKQDKGQFPYFRTYDQAAKRMVELLNVAQAKAMARFLRAQEAGEALIERLNSEAPDAS